MWQRKPSDVGVDDDGLAECKRLVESTLEFLDRFDPVALRTAGLGKGDIVRVVELDQARFADRLASW